MDSLENEREWKKGVCIYGSIREIKGFESIHMKNIKDKVSFVVSGVVYLLFNLRLSSTLQESLIATGWQIIQTVPYVAGVTWVLISFLQYMANGQKMPWDRRLRLFFAIGIMVGLFLGIYEYAGVDVTQK